MITTVAIGTTAATVSGVQLQTCTNDAFGAAGWSDASGWPVGIGNGTGGAAVIETYLPLAQLNGAGAVRIGVTSTAGQTSDALLTTTGGAGSQPPVIDLGGSGPGTANPIPVLNPLTLGLLIALLGGALRWGRRWPGATRLLVLVVVMAGAGLAWAAFVRDGQTNDWAGVAPLASQTSTVTGPSKVVALFAKAEGGNLNFRIDAGITVGGNNPSFIAVAEVDRPNGIPGQNFNLSARLIEQSQSTVQSWQWSLGDGRQANGQTTSVVYNQPGFFVVTVTATRADGSTATGKTGVAIFDPSTQSVPGLNLPPLMGDVNGDGRVTLEDSDLIRKHVSGLELLPESSRGAADIDLDGAITETDAGLLDTALSVGQRLPSLLSPSSGALGAHVRLISPNLLDPASLIEIEVGDSAYVQRPIRLIPGYTNFLIPLDATNKGSTAVSPGPINVRVKRDGVVVQTLSFTVTAPLALPENPKQEIDSFFNSFLSLLEANQSAVSNALDSYGVSASDKEILLGILTASRQEIGTGFDQMRASLQQPGGDNLARLFLTFANANGGLPSDYQARVQACIQEQYSLAPQAAADDLIPEICRIKSVVSLIDQGGTWLGYGCDGLLVAAILSTPESLSGSLYGWAATCGVAAKSLELAKFVASIVSGLDLQTTLSADPISPSNNQASVISATMTVNGARICEFAVGKTSEQMTKEIIKLAVERVLNKYLSRSIAEIIEKLGEGAAEKIRALLAKYLNKVPLPGVEQVVQTFQRFASTVCNRYGSNAQLPLDLDGILTPHSPKFGQLKFFPDGHAEYTCPTDTEISGDIKFTARVVLCDEVQFRDATVSCSSGRFELLPSSVQLSGKSGESYFKQKALDVKNVGANTGTYQLLWGSQPMAPNVELAGFSSDTVLPGESRPVYFSFNCPAEGGESQGRLVVKRLGNLGEVSSGPDDSSNITLTCSCEKKCCDQCCQEGQLPPKCCPGDTSAECSNTWGDPHLTTFDGLAYDFQGVGEFILVKSLLPNDTFEVQARHKPWGSRTEVSITQAVAMKVVTDRVGFYSGLDPALRINGTPTALAEGGTITLPSGGNIVRLGGVYRVSWPDTSAVDIRDSGGYLDVSMRVPAAKYGQIIGLLGNADSNTQNDVTIRNGASLGTQVEFKTLYPSYADSWRITQQESLFDYAPGETTETFTDRNFPRVRATVADLTEEVRAQAEQICRAAGITDPILLNNCILDVALTGNSEFAKIPADAAKPKEVVEIIAPPPPTINTPGFGQFKGSVLDAITTQALNAGQVLLTVNGAPLPRVTTRAITNGAYETDVVPIGSGYQLDIQADGYIAEKVFGLSAWDRQVRQVEPVHLVPVTASGVGTISGHIGNALDNSNVPNLNVFARRYINQRLGDPIQSVVTDQSGNFSLQGLAAGNYTLELQGNGYITKYLTVISIGGQTRSIDEIISPELGAARFRTVLTWSETPRDLDAHLTGPDGQGGRFHVYFSSTGNANLTVSPYAYLDRDDTDSFGPETTTIGKLQSGGVYRYSVHDYSNGGSTSSQALAQSGARVEVYSGSELTASFTVPNQEGTLWTVFEIDEAGRIIPVNQMSYASSSANISSAGRSSTFRASSDTAPSTATDYWQILFQADKK